MYYQFGEVYIRPNVGPLRTNTVQQRRPPDGIIDATARGCQE